MITNDMVFIILFWGTWLLIPAITDGTVTVWYLLLFLLPRYHRHPEPLPETGQQATVSRTTERVAQPEEQLLAEGRQMDVAKNSQNTLEEVQEPYIVVEEPPQFPGGQDALMEYIYNNIKHIIDRIGY